MKQYNTKNAKNQIVIVGVIIVTNLCQTAGGLAKQTIIKPSKQAIHYWQ
jgi:hypothetical protein